MYNRKAGAPRGGRVHWLLWSLPSDFKGAYDLSYNYDKHNYTFVRYEGRKAYDIFIIKQTSFHYWQAMYVDLKLQNYEKFGANSTEIIAEKMYLRYT